MESLPQSVADCASGVNASGVGFPGVHRADWSASRASTPAAIGRFSRHAREVACCLRRSCAARRGGVPRTARASCRCAPWRQPRRLRLDRPRASYRSQNRPARTRSIHAGGNSAGCWRKALLRSQTRARAAAVRASCVRAVRRRPPALDPRRRSSTSAAAGTPARRRAACVGRSCAAGRGRVRGGARLSAAASAMAGATRGKLRVH